MESTSVLPPFQAIWNVARMSVSLEGIGVKNLQLEQCPRLPSSYRSYCGPDGLGHPHTPFSASIDSAFLFILTVKGVLPIVAGCYAGHPAPINSAYTVLAPEKIRKKPPPKTVTRPKVKLTKIQKKALKVRRRRAANLKKRMEKIYKEAEKRRHKLTRKERASAKKN